MPMITPRLLELSDTLRKVCETHELQQDRRKDDADSHRRPGPTYAHGDLVLVECHTLSNASKGEHLEGCGIHF